MSDEKIRINIGTIGHVDHGKTTLTAAITKVISTAFAGMGNKLFGYGDIDNAPEERQRGITINQRTLKYETDKIVFSHVDCPGHADYVKNMITGTSQMDTAILVVSANDGVCPQTKEHVILAKQIGVKNIVVFLNKCDMADPDFVELTEEEVKELLQENGYDLSKVFFFKGSALKALDGEENYAKVILDMIDTISNKMPLPERDIDKPFKMNVENKYSITGRGTVLAGGVQFGQLSPNEELHLVGPQDKPFDVRVLEIEAFHQKHDKVQAGWNVGVLIKGVEFDDIQRGMILCAKNSIKTYKYAKAEIYLLKKEEGGRRSPIHSGYRPQFYIGTGDFTGSITLEGSELLLPGDHATVSIEFHCNVPLEIGTQFVIREGGVTVSSGKITAVSATPFK